MKRRFWKSLAVVVAAALQVSMAPPDGMAESVAQEPLPSWNDGPAKQAIVEFVGKGTRSGSPDFVPPAERIAVFDNDGTGTLAGGEKALVELVMASHAGTTTAEFDTIVKGWISTAKHPQTEKLYTEMVYQPMLELLAFLRANGFKTCIVSAGGIEFMRLSPSPSNHTSGAGPSPPSATPTATCKCCSGPPPAAASASASTSTTPTPNANGPTIASRTWAASTKDSTKPGRRAGRSSA